MVDPIPAGYPRVTPYLIVDDADAAIDFYSSVLGATSLAHRSRWSASLAMPLGHSRSTSTLTPSPVPGASYTLRT